MFIVICYYSLKSSKRAEPCRAHSFILLQAHVIVVVTCHFLSDVTDSSFAYWCFWVVPTFQSCSYFPIIFSRPLVDDTNLLINTNGRNVDTLCSLHHPFITTSAFCPSLHSIPCLCVSVTLGSSASVSHSLYSSPQLFFIPICIHAHLIRIVIPSVYIVRWPDFWNENRGHFQRGGQKSLNVIIMK